MSTTALTRALGLLDAVFIGLGAMIGAGIFVVLGVAAGVAGPAVILAIVLAAVPATANALSSAQLAAQFPEAGGTYAYGLRTLGPAWGFTAGWVFLVGKVAAAGTVALGLGDYLAPLVPALSPRIVAVAVALAVTALNYAGIQRTSRANIAMVTLAVLALIGFAAIALPEADTSHLEPLAPHGWRSVAQATALLFFAYTGYARIATLGEEVQDPARTIPRAIGFTMAITVGLYVVTAVAAVSAVGAASLAASPAPLAAAAETVGGAGAGVAVAVGALAAMSGVILSQILGVSRMVFAMGREGDAPKALARVAPGRGVPHLAVLVTGAAVAVVAATGALAAVVSTAAFTILLYYGIANLAALRMPAEHKRYPDAIPVIGLASCGLLAAQLEIRTIALGLGLLALGLAGRALLRRPMRA